MVLPAYRFRWRSAGMNTLRVGKIDAPIIVLHHFRMDRFVRQIDQERFVVPPLDELHRIAAENIRDVAGRLDRLAVFVDVGIEVRALSLETHPAIEARARRVVIAHVPFANKGGFVTRLMQQQRKGHQLMTGGRAINVVGDPVGVRVLPGQKAGARRRAERRGHKGIAEQSRLLCRCGQCWAS